jgi:MoxR-like ATPase
MGALFLDEIGDMPLELQPKLLRALQEREFERLGSTQTVRVNVRMVAATNQDLGQLVSKKLFRADLFYRDEVAPGERFTRVRGCRSGSYRRFTHSCRRRSGSYPGNIESNRLADRRAGRSGEPAWIAAYYIDL